MDRRRFVAGLMAGAAGCWLPMSASGRALGVLPPARFAATDRFDVTHRVRDEGPGEQPEPDEKHEVVVVGGGISALTAATRLAPRDVLVLEKEPVAGGNSRAGEIAGCRVALGAFLNQGPVAPFGEFFADLGVRFHALAPADHATHAAGRLVRDPFGAGLGRLGLPADAARDLARATDRLRGMLDPERGLRIVRAENGPAMLALDRVTLWDDYATQGYAPATRALLDDVVAARVADSGEKLSAWIGNYLLSQTLAPAYTMAGGHAAVTEALLDRLGRQPGASLRCGFTVTRVAQRGEAVWVTGIGADGRRRSIAADAVVLGVPKLYARRIVDGLDAARPGVYGGFAYNAYLVTQVSLTRRIDAPFETTAPGRLARYIVAPDNLPGNARHDGGGVLTVYSPFPRVAGRSALYVAAARDLAERIAADLAAVLPETRGRIADMTLHRWGHPMLTLGPGMDSTLDAAKESFGRVVFAHSDSFGLTGLYSAVWTGMEAEAETAALLA
ncbi:FAD-dependent oxidoreductase [Derxia gummosa]|uniref:FAD-dependent oxidoreductase n=1 Tax=Derxia gummosa DSM 723 TaxID=1121388 RepID=A0A8B6X6E0_9BURK|nr:FAD-dependent oxidoreductase [Derxia gummosa]